jgi:hypothetical protein
VRTAHLAAGLQRLALAVLEQALRDAGRRDHHGQQARWWLQHDTATLRHWCACAGVAPRQVQRLQGAARREALRRLRGRFADDGTDAQADALDIEAQAKRRLADEYDAAQQRGEVATREDNIRRGPDVPVENVGKPTVTDLGLTRKEIHEARKIRDAEQADPGIVRRTVDAA